jgi:hypothetical protein
MANNDRWRSDQDGLRYRDDDNRRMRKPRDQGYARGGGDRGRPGDQNPDPYRYLSQDPGDLGRGDYRAYEDYRGGGWGGRDRDVGAYGDRFGYGGEGQHRGRGPKGYQRSDERIREDVCDRLTDDEIIDPSDVEVTVSNCEVTLSGTVDDREQRRRAELLAEQVTGVTQVQNKLRVGQGAARSESSAAATGAGGETADTMAERVQAANTSATTGYRRRTRATA